MRGMLTVVVLFGATAAFVVPPTGAVSAHTAHVTTNPCLHDMEGHRELLEDVTRSFITSTSSASADWRATHGFAVWPRDSVQATTDSVVCTHVDSLLSAWMATPEAIAKNVARGGHWPGISVVRANPHRYMVSPPILADGFRWRFVVDSVSGLVQFYKTPQ